VKWAIREGSSRGEHRACQILTWKADALPTELLPPEAVFHPNAPSLAGQGSLRTILRTVRKQSLPASRTGSDNHARPPVPCGDVLYEIKTPNA
jgi:hypothetical protein